MYEGFLHGPFQLFMYFSSLPSKPMPKLSFSVFPIFIFIFKVNFTFDLSLFLLSWQ